MDGLKLNITMFQRNPLRESACVRPPLVWKPIDSNDKEVDHSRECGNSGKYCTTTLKWVNQYGVPWCDGCLNSMKKGFNAHTKIVPKYEEAILNELFAYSHDQEVLNPLWDLIQTAKQVEHGNTLLIIQTMLDKSEQTNECGILSTKVTLDRTGILTAFGPGLVMECCLAAQLIYGLLYRKPAMTLFVGMPVSLLMRLCPGILYIGPVHKKICAVVMDRCEFMGRGQYVIQIEDKDTPCCEDNDEGHEVNMVGLTSKGWMCQSKDAWIRHVQSNYHNWMVEWSNSAHNILQAVQSRAVKCILDAESLDVVPIDVYKPANDGLGICNVK